METWFLFALMSGVLAGGNSFLNKVSAVKGHNGSLVTFYAMLSGTILSVILILIFDTNISWTWLFFLVSIVSGVAYFLGVIARIESLKFIDTSLFFPLYKTLGPLFAVIISFVIFSESLSLYEWIGIIFGLIVPIILVRAKNAQSDNIKLGIFFLIICTIFTTITMVMGKIVRLEEFSILFYMLMLNFAGLVSSGIMYHTQKKKEYNKKHIVEVGILSGIFNVTAGFCFMNGLSGNFAIVVTINSFSFLVPIILSVIWYKEHFDLRKFLAIALTIFSIYLMK